jgi:hypothetical protein
VPVLEVATKSEAGAGRAPMSLALAQFLAGDRVAAEKSIEQAIGANANLVKVLLGRMPKRAANLGAATPGSKEEAYGYAQTYGDAWEAPAKKFLEEYMETRSALHKAAASEATPAEG